jgi:aminocarboxymuconate-semialdehyde decarboxylase
MIADVHAHALSEDFIVEAARSLGRFWRVEIAGPRHYVDAHYGPLDPLLFDLELRFSNLRSRQVSLQLVCPPPPLIAAPTHAADVSLARRLNGLIARRRLIKVPNGESDVIDTVDISDFCHVSKSFQK